MLFFFVCFFSPSNLCLLLLVFGQCGQDPAAETGIPAGQERRDGGAFRRTGPSAQGAGERPAQGTDLNHSSSVLSLPPPPLIRSFRNESDWQSSPAGARGVCTRMSSFGRDQSDRCFSCVCVVIRAQHPARVGGSGRLFTEDHRRWDRFLSPSELSQEVPIFCNKAGKLGNRNFFDIPKTT